MFPNNPLYKVLELQYWNWVQFILSIEGDQLDEVSIIGEVQYSLTNNAVLKLNCGFGVTEKAPNYAPEIGGLFKF